MTQDPDVHPEAIRLVMYPPGNKNVLVVSRTDGEAVSTVSRKFGLVNGGVRVIHMPTPEEVFELSQLKMETIRYDDE